MISVITIVREPKRFHSVIFIKNTFPMYVSLSALKSLVISTFVTALLLSMYIISELKRNTFLRLKNQHISEYPKLCNVRVHLKCFALLWQRTYLWTIPKNVYIIRRGKTNFRITPGLRIDTPCNCRRFSLVPCQSVLCCLLSTWLNETAKNDNSSYEIGERYD